MTDNGNPQIRLYTLDDMALLLKKTKRTIINYVDAGLIKTIRSGRTPLVTEEEYLRIGREGIDTRGMGKTIKKSSRKSK